METYSLAVASFTLYMGLYYATGVHYTYMSPVGVSWAFLVMFIVPNFGFLLYWAWQMRVGVLMLVYRLNKPAIFRIVSCTTMEAFYEAHVKAEEERK